MYRLKKNSMKNILIILLAVATLVACDKEHEPTAEELQLRKLEGTWSVTDVKKDDVVSAEYGDFQLTLSGSLDAGTFTYATSGRPETSPWPAGGSWAFGSTITSQVIRDAGSVDELIMNYSVNGSTLILEFDFSGDGYTNNRVNSPEGQWKFTLDKQ